MTIRNPCLDFVHNAPVFPSAVRAERQDSRLPETGNVLPLRPHCVKSLVKYASKFTTACICLAPPLILSHSLSLSLSLLLCELSVSNVYTNNDVPEITVLKAHE